MNRALLTFIWRRAWRVYLPLAAVILGWTLLASEPLGTLEPLGAALALALGVVLARAIFRDPPGVGEFLFSRVWTRDAIFWARWGVGLALIAGTVLACGVVIASKLRMAAHPHSVYYPMIHWYELNALWSVAVPALLAYQFTMLLLIRERTAERRGSGFASVEAIMMGLMLLVTANVLVGHSYARWVFPYLITTHFRFVTLVYPAAVLAVTTLASLRAHREMEIV